MTRYRWSNLVKGVGKVHIVGPNDKTWCQIENNPSMPAFTDETDFCPAVGLCKLCVRIEREVMTQGWMDDKAVLADPDSHPEPDYAGEIPPWVTEDIPEGWVR